MNHAGQECNSNPNFPSKKYVTFALKQNQEKLLSHPHTLRTKHKDK